MFQRYIVKIDDADVSLFGRPRSVSLERKVIEMLEFVQIGPPHGVDRKINRPAPFPGQMSQKGD